MTDQQLLPFQEAAWRVPHWCYDLGYMRSSQVLRLIKMHASVIHRAQLDDIEHVAPILLALRSDPAAARKRVGKAVWRVIPHSPLHVNVARANVLLQSRITIADLIHFPKGALREVPKKIREYGEPAIIVAGIIAKNRTEFREAVMLARDTIRMGGNIDRRWSLRRLREEHDRLAMQWAKLTSDPTPWADPWSCEVDGYRFTFLNSATAFAAEGQTMRHCVASYARHAKAGRYIIMKIEGKERATVRFGGHPVRVQEVKARFNRAVSDACRRACAKVCAEHLESVRKEQAHENP